MHATKLQFQLTLLLACLIPVRTLRPIDMTFGQWYHGTYQAPNHSVTTATHRNLSNT